REQAPLDPSWRLPLARAFAALERWPEARVVLEGITDARDPRRARESAELLAKCLLRLREYAACLAQCNRSLALFPDSVALARNRALAFAEGFVLGVETDARRVVDDAAMSFFEKVIADAARCEPVDFLTLARHLERRGACEEALAVAQEAARLAPFRPEGWGALAAILGILGPKEEASDARRKAGVAERRLRSLRAKPPETKKA